MDGTARPVRVLVDEDDEEIAQVLQRSLRLEGYEVKLAADGVRGLDEAHAFLPDITVLDLRLPRLAGLAGGPPVSVCPGLWSAGSVAPACGRCCAAGRHGAWPRCASATSR